MPVTPPTGADEDTIRCVRMFEKPSRTDDPNYRGFGGFVMTIHERDDIDAETKVKLWAHGPSGISAIRAGYNDLGHNVEFLKQAVRLGKGVAEIKKLRHTFNKRKRQFDEHDDSETDNEHPISPATEAAMTIDFLLDPPPLERVSDNKIALNVLEYIKTAPTPTAAINVLKSFLVLREIKAFEGIGTQLMYKANMSYIGLMMETGKLETVAKMANVWPAHKHDILCKQFMEDKAPDKVKQWLEAALPHNKGKDDFMKVYYTYQLKLLDTKK